MTTTVKFLRAAVSTTHNTLDRVDNLLDALREWAYQVEKRAARMNVEAKQKALELKQFIVGSLQQRLSDAQFDLIDAHNALEEADSELFMYEQEDAQRVN